MGIMKPDRPFVLEDRRKPSRMFNELHSFLLKSRPALCMGRMPAFSLLSNAGFARMVDTAGVSRDDLLDNVRFHIAGNQTFIGLPGQPFIKFSFCLYYDFRLLKAFLDCFCHDFRRQHHPLIGQRGFALGNPLPGMPARAVAVAGGVDLSCRNNLADVADVG